MIQFNFNVLQITILFVILYYRIFETRYDSPFRDEMILETEQFKIFVRNLLVFNFASSQPKHIKDTHMYFLYIYISIFGLLFMIFHMKYYKINHKMFKNGRQERVSNHCYCLNHHYPFNENTCIQLKQVIRLDLGEIIF